MKWMLGASIFFLIISLLYFFKANLVVKLNEWGKRVLFNDEWTIGYRLSVGVFFLIASIALFILYLIKFGF